MLELFSMFQGRCPFPISGLSNKIFVDLTTWWSVNFCYSAYGCVRCVVRHHIAGGSRPLLHFSGQQGFPTPPGVALRGRINISGCGLGNAATLPSLLAWSVELTAASCLSLPNLTGQGWANVAPRYNARALSPRLAKWLTCNAMQHSHLQRPFRSPAPAHRFARDQK